MKNIYDLLTAIGINFPTDKKEAFEKEFHSNYKTVAEVEKLDNKLDTLQSERDTLKSKYAADIKKRDEDLAAVQIQLQNVGGDKSKLEEATKKLDDLQAEYDKTKKDYENQLGIQKYEFAAKELAAELKFTSNSAKKSFMNDLMTNKLSMKDGEILGFDDFVAKYKEQDEGAFVKEDDPAGKGGEGDNSGEKKKPTFAGPNNKMDPEGKPGEEEKELPLVW